MTPDRESAHDKLLRAAQVLFYAHGISSTGIDAIIKRAGVAKKSLYNNFSSKDALIAAYLQVRHQEWLDFYQRRVAQAATPREKVIAVFAAYGDHAEFAYEHGFRGCGLLNAAAEFPADSAGRREVRKHKEQVEAILVTHLAELANPQGRDIALLARHFSFLLEGSICRAGLEGNSACITQACAMAQQLMEAL
ncbi:TetR family transcriptional regulator (plasmid) [Erwinia sp. E602]|uniref:TetR/AcrR family transcriptional regulator n=1 Tax=unclassified Erwinia TaxID=2622719 RepID=UPI0006F88591|nr:MULTISPECIES: TetR/AcrR family transcriptional regulator [unclassified Erwinia]KQN55547.1 TetR family transcriptional regulator [Erwinia sp. Leaf53]PLV63831.1 TetR family transcriptional regulator [Erwinia sp. B116]QUG73596.1 TetR family transcriptional regulator [Erwinia sp. E602]